MLRVPIWTSAIVFIAGASVAAPSPELLIQAPQAERPSLARDWSAEEPALPVEDGVTSEEFVIARKGGGRGGGGRGGGNRGGAKSKNRGGFNKGNKRHAQRHAGEPGRLGRPGDPGGIRGGEPGRPGRPGDPGGIRGGRVGGFHNVRDGNVNVNRNVNVGGGGGYYDDGDWDDDDDDGDLGSALVGGAIGLGVGALLNRDTVAE